MTWTYTGNPSSSAKDTVRFLLGDTDENDPQISDEEIGFLVTSNSNDVYNSAIQGCRTLAAKYAREVNSKIDSVSVDAGERKNAYLALIPQLEKMKAESASGALDVGGFVGGVSDSEMHAVTEDTDRVDPAFTRDMHANPPGLISGDSVTTN